MLMSLYKKNRHGVYKELTTVKQNKSKCAVGSIPTPSPLKCVSHIWKSLSTCKNQFLLIAHHMFELI